MPIQTDQQSFEQAMRDCIIRLHTYAPDSIGDRLSLQLEECSAEARTYTLRAATKEWMRNVNHTLHGGMCATILDQAMGFVAYCAMPGAGISPTIQLQVSYLRAIPVGEDVLVRMHVASVTKSLIHITAEAWTGEDARRICLTGSATYFFKPAPPEA